MFYFNMEVFIKCLWIFLYLKLIIISKKENLKYWFLFIKNDNWIFFGNLLYGCCNKNLENIVLFLLFGFFDIYFLNDLLLIYELLVLYIYI